MDWLDLLWRASWARYEMAMAEMPDGHPDIDKARDRFERVDAMRNATKEK